MKNPVMSFWLSAANQAAGWWLGTATSLARRQHQIAMAEMAKGLRGKRRSKMRMSKTKRRMKA